MPHRLCSLQAALRRQFGSKKRLEVSKPACGEQRVWPRGPRRGDMLGGVHGHGDASDRLLVGVEFSDGRRCTNIGSPFPPGFHDSAGRPLLTPGGGSGGTRSSDISLFLSPLPPPGDIRVVCAWPKFGLPEKITVLSADAMLEAARRVRVLWPWEPEPEPVWGAKPPAVPEGGWFAEQES
jgi:hypothetical protein